MAVEFDLPDVDPESASPRREFLEALARTLDPSVTRSVLLFGSVRTGEATAASDVDLVVALTDDAPDAELERVRERCDELATTHLAAGESPSNGLERAIDRATGMFRSGFVVRAGQVRAGRFHAIFETSRLAYWVAPWRTVLASVFAEADPISGAPLAPAWEEIGRPGSRRIREAVRSWLTTVLLAAAQLAYVLVSDRAQHYAMEAHKWALYNCAYLLDPGPTTLEGAIETAPGNPRMDAWFTALRAAPQRRYSYIAIMPAYVTYVHVATIARLLRGL